MNERGLLTGKPAMRSSNLELLRIIAMFMIVAHHYVVNSGIKDVVLETPKAKTTIALMLYGGWGKIGINVFILITGYFMCKSDITLRKFVKLMAEIMFYKIVIYLIFFISGYGDIKSDDLLAIFIPINSIQKNFISCFIIFWLCIPFLNILIRNLDRKKHLLLIALTGFVYIILGTLKRTDFNYVTWFIVLYFIASFIRMYPFKIYESRIFWTFMAVITVAVSAASIVIMTWRGGNPYKFVSDSNTALAVITGISLFMFFKNLKMPNSKIINAIASATFGVLLLHAGSNTLRIWVWNTVDPITAYSNHNVIPNALISVTVIFFGAVVIDLLRIHLLEKPFLKWFDKISKKGDGGNLNKSVPN